MNSRPISADNLSHSPITRMNRSGQLHGTLIGTLLSCLAADVGLSAQVIDRIDRKSFLARHDMVWKHLPDRFENAAFTGNGHLGAMVYTTHIGETPPPRSSNRTPRSLFILALIPLAPLHAAEKATRKPIIRIL
jgi:hypothetical protein